MISATYPDGRGDGRTAGIVPGTIGGIRRRSGVGKDGGGGCSQPVFTKTAANVVPQVRGTTADGRRWVMTTGAE